MKFNIVWRNFVPKKKVISKKKSTKKAVMKKKTTPKVKSKSKVTKKKAISKVSKKKITNKSSNKKVIVDDLQVEEQPKKKKLTAVPLIIEPHPKEYDGYPFITLIQHRDNHLLSIIDNFDGKEISAFVLDLCAPEGISEEEVVHLAKEWYEASNARYPISFEFSRKGVADKMSKILKAFNVDFVTRVIGPLPQFPMNSVKSIKRRRRKPIPYGVELNKKIIKL